MRHDSSRKGRTRRMRNSSPFRNPDAVLGAGAPRSVVAMVKLSKEAKQRLQQLFKGGQFAIRWGFIPLVIYLGQWEKSLGGAAGLCLVGLGVSFLAFLGGENKPGHRVVHVF
ncbi:mitochondrial import receptor subunit TOM7-like [Sigmodon hispidus]